jgi:hypothetical protein
MGNLISMATWRLPQREVKRKPKYVGCHYRLDLVPPTSAVLLDAYHAAKDKASWVILPYRPLPTGSVDHQCWRNVEKAVELWGGQMQPGWYFHHDPMSAKNYMAAIEAIAHAVWRSPAGQLFEVSEDCEGAPFFPSEVVRPYMALNVGFCDDLFHASTYCPTNPVLAVVSGNAYCKIHDDGGPM